MTTEQKAEPKALSPITEIKNNIQMMSAQFKAALPKHINPDKFMRVALTAVQNNPELLTVDRHSLYGAITKCAQDGLLPDGREAAITIFNKNIGTKDSPKYAKCAQHMPMIAGILKKMRNSGEIGPITVECVYSEDKFRYWVDQDGAHIEHEPNFFSARGNKIGAYSVVKFKGEDGDISIEVMSKADIEKVKQSSKTSKYGPWSDWEDEMYKKTVLRRHSKRLPSSTDLEMIFKEDDLLEDQIADEVTNTTQPPPKKSTKPAKLGKLIEESQAGEDNTSGDPRAMVVDHVPSDELPL